jgi:UDP-N-acetylmuramate dehydrogenase
VRRGGAFLDDGHEGMMVKAGGATAVDVMFLMRTMRDNVREKFGVTLVPEVELLGLKWE